MLFVKLTMPQGSVFRRHMAMLAERDFTVVTHEAIMRWLYGGADLPAGNVACIGFDDNRLIGINVSMNMTEAMFSRLLDAATF